MTIRISGFLVCVVFLWSTCESDLKKFVDISIFSEGGCLDEFYLTEWAIEFPTDCIEYPFSHNNKFWLELNESSGKNIVKYSRLDSECQEILQNYTYNTDECSIFLDGSNTYFLNFSIYDSVPFNPSSPDTGWLFYDSFSDNSCQNIVSNLNSIASTTTGYYYQSGSWSDYQYRCIGDYLVANVDTAIFNIISISLKENVCIPYYPVYYTELYSYKSYLDGPSALSIRFKCESHDYYNQNYFPKFLSIQSSPNALKYELLHSSYDVNCSTHRSSLSLAFGICIESFGYVVSTPNEYFQAHFSSPSTCLPNDINEFLYYNSDSFPSLYSKCSYYHTNPIRSMKMYWMNSIAEDPYSPTQIARFVSYGTRKCGDDLIDIFKNPEPNLIQYYDSETCHRVDPALHVLDGYLSYKGYCDVGVLKIRAFYQTNDCFGSYNELTIPEGMCEVQGSDYYHYVCIPRFCGDYSENDENVCSGRGKCILKNFCECDHGYEGSLCDSFYCYKIDSRETNVCSGNGNCESFDKCICNIGFSGERCQRSDLITFAIIFSSITGSFFTLFVSLLICCVCSCCLACCVLFLGCCLALVLSCTTVGGMSGLNIFQKKRLSRFERLEDFEILLTEQLLEKDSSTAHIKINKKLFEIPYEEVHCERIIGQGGSNATVFKGSWKGSVVAFKSFKTREMFSTQENFDSFESEVNFLVNINHPSIIRCFGASLKPPRVGIVMEFCENGEILDFIISYREKTGSEYPRNEKFRMAKEICSAGSYIHSRNIIHRDIKPENVLIDSSERCKLMDFGISRIIESSEGEKTKCVGTNLYIAPEVLSGKYDHKVDVFSFSILLFVIFSELKDPYGSHFRGEFVVAGDANYRPDVELLKDILKNEEEYEMLKDILIKCWSHDIDERLEFSDLEKMFEKKWEEKNMN